MIQVFQNLKIKYMVHVPGFPDSKNKGGVRGWVLDSGTLKTDDGSMIQVLQNLKTKQILEDGCQNLGTSEVNSYIDVRQWIKDPDILEAENKISAYRWTYDPGTWTLKRKYMLEVYD